MLSHSAVVVAQARASHQIYDVPLVLHDPLALRVLGDAERATLRDHEARERHPWACAFRAFIIARSRVVEDELATASARGVRQYVVLGAGLDTFAYRNPHAELRVFELDRADSVAAKRARLVDAAIPIPLDVAYVAANLDDGALTGRLVAAGFQRGAAAVVSALGLTPYLSAGAYTELLALFADLAPGSVVILDHAIPREALAPARRATFDLLSGALAARGEPMRLFRDPAALASELADRGLRVTAELDGGALHVRYFAGRDDALTPRDTLAQLAIAVRA